jgi:hypothetical protein
MDITFCCYQQPGDRQQRAREELYDVIKIRSMLFMSIQLRHRDIRQKYSMSLTAILVLLTYLTMAASMYGVIESCAGKVSDRG